MTELLNILKDGQEDNFCAEIFAEWFVNGETNSDQLAELTAEQCDEIYDNIADRWSVELADHFDNVALPLI